MNDCDCVGDDEDDDNDDVNDEMSQPQNIELKELSLIFRINSESNSRLVATSIECTSNRGQRQPTILSIRNSKYDSQSTRLEAQAPHSRCHRDAI